MSLYPAVLFPASAAAVEGWPPEAGGARAVAVRVADLRSPMRRPLREGDRTALTAAGGEKIRTGDLAVFLKPVAVAPAVVRRDGRVQAGGHPADHARLGVIEQQLDEMTGLAGTIGQVAAQVTPRGKVKGTARRSMTMAAALRAVLLMTLMPEAGYGEILAALFGDLAMLPWQAEFAVPTGTVLATWREAAGPDPLLRLQEMVLAGSDAEHEDHDYRAIEIGDLRLGSVDGSVTRMPDTPANRAEFGSAGTGDDSAPYPQLRDLPVTDAATRAMLAVVTGPSGGDKAAAEQALLDRALAEYAHVFTKSRLFVMDRNFPGIARIKRLVKVTHVLIRLKSDITVTKTGDFLPDGSYMADIGGKDEKTRIGALPVVAGICSRLRIRDIVDDACPVRDLAELTHGQVIEALVANRLTSPSPLVHIQSWARDWAVGETLGVEPELLNDDRIGRALDAIAPHLDQIAGSVGVTAIGAFGIDVTRMHWDMTSISMRGEYEQNEEGFAAPKFGHPKDRRPDLKQVQAGIAVSADGAVPVFHRAFDGGAGEVGQVIGVMKALQEMATQRRLLIIGDSKLISYANLAAMAGDGVAFVAPASKTYVPAAELVGLTMETATEVGYVAQRDQAKPADRRGVWHVLEDTMMLAGSRKKDPVLTLRRVFVHSSARAGAAATARAKKLQRAQGDLERLERGLGSRHYPTVDKVNARISVIIKDRRVGAYLSTATGTGPGTGKPTLTWVFDQDAIDAEAGTDGWYALLSNLPPDDADAAQVLILYKGQEAVERRYSAFKGPLAVAALFCKNNRRIAALVTVICLALLIFCLVERQVRQALAAQDETKVEGLYAGRPAIPTGRLIFQALATIKIIPGVGQKPPIIPQPTPLQLRLLGLLDMDPRQLR